MGYCICKEYLKATEVPVPSLNETKPKVPARKSTKLIKLKGMKDISLKETDLSTEYYLRTKSLLKQSQLNSSLRKQQSTEGSFEIREVSIRSTNNSFATYNQLQPDELSQFQNLNDDEKMLIILKNHFLLKDFNDEHLRNILDEMIEYQIEENNTIFNKGQQGAVMFIIKTGQVELTMNNNKSGNDNNNNTIVNHHASSIIRSNRNDEDEYDNSKVILNAGDIFGELSLVIENALRSYSARSITPLIFYLINSNSYQSSKSKAGSIYSKKNNLKTNTGLIEYLNKNPIMKMLNLYHQECLTALSYKKRTIKSEEFQDNDTVYVLIEGNCICDLEKTKIIAEPGVFLGLEDVFNFDTKKNMKKQITSISDCTFIAIPIKAFIEVLGVNYKYLISFQLFKAVIHNSDNLSGLINENQAKSMFNAFTFKSYQNNDIIYSAASKSDLNKKVVIVFDGEISYNKTSINTLARVGELYGDTIIDSNYEICHDIISKGNSLLYECHWDKIKDVAKLINNDLSKKIRKLKSIDFLKGLNEIKLMEISQKIIPFSYLQNEVIISPKIPSEHFYFILKGEVKHKINNKIHHIYTHGQSFGELYLLNKQESKSYFIASTNIVKTYAIHKDYFFQLIEDQHLNDAIKRKMTLENSKIQLHQLYHISLLGKGRFGNIHLVHNTHSLYAIKTINKIVGEKHQSDIYQLINEKNALFELNHPFIVKVVKTLRNAQWCTCLMEYIQGINLEDYLEEKQLNQQKISIDIESIKFYGASLCIIIDYLHKHSYIHRGIHPSALMLDQYGYIKLIDMSISKQIKSNTTNTIIGTPHYMAPEVIKGSDYSYESDYWSIGIFLYYLYYNEYPYGNSSNNIIDVYNDILSKTIMYKNNDTNVELNHFINSLLKSKSEERCTNFKDIERAMLFKNYPWNQLENKQLKSPITSPIIDKCINDSSLKIINMTFNTRLENERITNDRLKPTKYNFYDLKGNKISNPYTNKYERNWYDEFLSTI